MEAVYKIVRTANAGVFMGVVEFLDKELRMVRMTNARRLWYWSGAASLSELSISGVKNPKLCKFPIAVPEVQLFEVIEILPCSDEAIKSINAVPVWSA